MSTNTVIVATTSLAQRNQIATLVNGLKDFVVIAKTGDLMNTYTHVEEKVPNVVLISEPLASLPEFEVMRALFATLDVRWLVLTSLGASHRSKSSINPGSDLFSIPGNSSAAVIEGQLRSLTRHGRHSLSPISRERSLKNRKPVADPATSSAPRPALKQVASTALPARETTKNTPIILIGASTGGVDALLTVLGSFPIDCPPTLIVQHTGAGFGESLAGLLDRQCKPRIALSNGEAVLERGQITIGAGNKAHLVLQNDAPARSFSMTGDPVSGHLPSVDMLFKSGLRWAERISAALLTGMGKDGADGLLQLRKAGARTFAQDEASSVVFGMPRAAIENGAATAVLPIDKIGPALLKGPQSSGLQPRKVLS
ncbi:chemotaxis protein CheB [Tropicibacter sp. R15_0]|uniref:CheB methylesterase domain-containing protein n=1 Tax=Tropicibacter sp. R15_0 TaxID=2821101 RepID=UPI001ADCC2D2|nr:chemotaxis protein CheB [Tropicibacter sp. R15_0]